MPRKLAPPGDEPYCRVVWTGPTSYTQVGTTPVVNGVAPTNGDQVSAGALGVNVILYIEPATSYTGNFMVVPIRMTESKWTLKWIALVTGSIDGQSQTLGTEAVSTSNLSGEYVKLTIHTLSA